MYPILYNGLLGFTCHRSVTFPIKVRGSSWRWWGRWQRLFLQVLLDDSWHYSRRNHCRSCHTTKKNNSTPNLVCRRHSGTNCHAQLTCITWDVKLTSTLVQKSWVLNLLCQKVCQYCKYPPTYWLVILLKRSFYLPNQYPEFMDFSRPRASQIPIKAPWNP